MLEATHNDIKSSISSRRGLTYDFGMIVFNGMPWIKYVLEEIVPHAHQIIVVQGPVKRYAELKGITKSDDGTVEFLQDFAAKHSNVIVINGSGWEDKLEQSQEYTKFVTGDYLWIVDADEVYKSEEIPKIKKWIKDNNIEISNFPEFRFWGDLEHYARGGSWNDCPPRLFKWEPGARFCSHRPPAVEFPDGRIVKLKNILAPDGLVQSGLYMYHYNYIGDRRIRDKSIYFAKLRPDDPVYSRYMEWHDMMFAEWRATESEYVKENLENIYGLHPNGAGVTEIFTGEHPASVRKAIESGELSDLSKF